MNGAVSFGASFSAFTPSAFPLDDAILFTPFWGDIDTTNGGNCLYREETEDSEALAMADNVIRSTFVHQQDFSSTWLYIVTWDQVPFFGSTSPQIVSWNCDVIEPRLNSV